MKKLIPALFLVLLTACASSSDSVKAKYVSPLQYQGYSCNQIRQEMMIVSRKVNSISGVQDRHASGDAVAVGVSLIFWPSLFFLASKDQAAELGDLKGQYDALEQVAVHKNCSVAREIQAAKNIEEKRNKDQKVEPKKPTQNE